MYDVAIIGAGIVGAMTARLLSKYDLKLCVIERENDAAMGATKANSAIVHAGFDAKHGTLKAKLNVRGAAMMADICRELGVRYQNNGALVLGFGEADRAKLRALLDNGRANGVSGLRLLEKQALKELEPNVSDNAVCALYAPTSAIVCPYDLCIAALGSAMDNGTEFIREFTVSDITYADSQYRIKSADGRTVTAKAVVNAAGVFADEIAKMIGDDSFDIHARSGEYLLLDKECGTLVKHTVFTAPTNMGKGILVSPTVDGNLLLGPTAVDKTDKENKATTRQGLDTVMKKAGEMVDNIDLKMAITSFCGLRAVGSTGDFIINMPKKHFVHAAGIESPGLSASPAIAEYVVELLAKDGLPLAEKADYQKPHRRYSHFHLLPDTEKNKVIEQDASFGHIVCRCEMISEGEILHALRTNPKPCDLDGVKRRTRAQMGRCQGGFCAPYIMELIAQELGIPLEQVTKCGHDSYVVLGKTKEAAEDANG